MAQILLIGGTGNISAECATRLYQDGHKIAIVSRSGNEIPSQCRPVRADRKDAAAMRTALGDWKPDIVINFLGYELSDVQLDFELFRGAVRQYIFISSATVYAKPPQILPITESSPLGNAFWEYAQKKLACEEWLRQRGQAEGFPVTVVRPSHTYSKCWIPNPVSSSSYSFAARLEQGKPVYVPDKGETLWTLTAASDFATGLAGLVDNQRAVGEAFHITSDEALTWNQIVLEIADALGAPAPQIIPVPTELICQVAPQMTGTLKGDKAHPGVFNNAKMKQFVPQFHCEKPFHVGVRESVAWLRAHPEKQKLNSQVDAICDAVIKAQTFQWV